jgi:hypothetical protein
MAFVKLIHVHPNQVAIQTEAGMRPPIPAAQRNTLQSELEDAVIERGLRGYIELNGTFEVVDS